MKNVSIQSNFENRLKRCDLIERISTWKRFEFKICSSQRGSITIIRKKNETETKQNIERTKKWSHRRTAIWSKWRNVYLRPSRVFIVLFPFSPVWTARTVIMRQWTARHVFSVFPTQTKTSAVCNMYCFTFIVQRYCKLKTIVALRVYAAGHVRPPVQ